MGHIESAVEVAPSMRLEASVSFGRFEADSLSWEKWSTFSANKYLEEVEKCATPGSVAQKKAYFEARYKKIIAARKSESMLDQDKQIQSSRSIRWDSSDSGDSVGGKDEILTSSFAETFAPRNSAQGVTEGDEDMSKISENNYVSRDEIEEKRLENCPELSKPDDIASMEESQGEVLIESPRPPREELEKDSKNDMCVSSTIQEENPKMKLHEKHQKANPVNYDEKNAGRLMKKSGPPPRVKAPGISPAKTTKPALPKSLEKGAVKPSRVGSKNPSNREKKNTVFPKSLHMSMSLASSQSISNPPSSNTQMRKSLIMERMSEKNIVKRAFKSFQNSVGLSKSFIEERSPSHKPAPSMAMELRASISVANQKDTGRSNQATVRSSPRPVGTSSFSSRSNDKADQKRKEPQKKIIIQKKLGEKPDAENVKRTQVQSRMKEEKEAEAQKLRKNVHFKATPLPSFYRRQHKSKSSMRPDGYKSEIFE